MPKTTDYLTDVGTVVKGLSHLGLTPVLVGGMALVILGSRRVTRDFDFVVATPHDGLDDLVDVLYGCGLELASRLDDDGEVVSTIDNRKVAAARLRIDGASSAYFFNPATRLRIDLLFDFPIPAAELAAGATRTKVRSQVLYVASEADLLRLKRIAQVQRSAPGDAQDIAFLEARQRQVRE